MQTLPKAIKTVCEDNRILQVMEYCEYDLFAIVIVINDLRGNMLLLKQILTGVHIYTVLVSAHRDLKLKHFV